MKKEQFFLEAQEKLAFCKQSTIFYRRIDDFHIFFTDALLKKKTFEKCLKKKLLSFFLMIRASCSIWFK